MRCAFVNLELRVFNQLGLQSSGIIDRHDLIIIALDNERWDVNPLQIFVLIRFRKRLDAKVRSRETTRDALEPKRFPHSLRNFGAGAIVTVEREREVSEEFRAISGDPAANIVKHFLWQAAGILVRLVRFATGRARITTTRLSIGKRGEVSFRFV